MEALLVVAAICFTVVGILIGAAWNESKVRKAKEERGGSMYSDLHTGMKKIGDATDPYRGR